MKEIARFLLKRNDFSKFVHESEQILKSFLLDYENSQGVKENLIEDISNFLKPFIDDFWIFIEFPYIDRLYRSSYYHYFSSKLTNISRDCMRLSFFKPSVTRDHFENGNLESIQESFLGYLVLRPLKNRWIGRNLISPSILKKSNIACCQMKEEISVNGMKLIATGFPHQSQDGEYCVCAETSIWSLVEYYSHTFPEYSSALLGDISSTSDLLKFDRSVPSSGLSLYEISQVLKHFGFNTKIHSEIDDIELSDKDFLRKLMNIYIQSGIPLLCSIEFEECSLGHAVLAIGHERSKEIDCFTDEEDIRDYDLMSENHKIVTMNDNKSPYYVVDFDEPTHDYEEYLRNSSFSGFIAPLHKKVYMSAIEAQKLSELLFNNENGDENVDIYSFLGLEDSYFKKNGPIFHNLFLTSSKNYKSYIFNSEELSPFLKDSINSLLLPKYIWVIELSNQRLYKKELINGFILIDATSYISSDDLLENMIIYFDDSLFFKSNEYNDSKRVFKGQKPFKRYRAI